MDASQFQALFDTLNLDATIDASETIRAETVHSHNSTVAFGGLPSVDLGGSTNPEFELGPTIGEGGMGVVRSANQIALHREVAVKTLRAERKDDWARAGLLHEALVMGGLEHPNIVPVYTLGQTSDGAPVIVMKRVEGVPWSQVIHDPSSVPNFDFDDPQGWHLEIFGQVCQAVAFAHAGGILHRDIKPENVMIGAFGEVYLVDWGVAVTTDDAKAEFLSHVRDANSVAGTPSYMAPEMTTGQGEGLGEHTDVYLLGATLYHVLTGEVPHRGDSLFQIMFRAYESAPVPAHDMLPDGILEICRAAMAKEPADRFVSADAVRRAVHAYERHRSSIALADEAGTRLQTLRQLVAEGDERNEDALRRIAGECRFGLEQALRVWPGNEAASRDLSEMIRAMVRWELHLENVRAAEALLTSLDDEPELAAELEQLRLRHAEQAQEVEELRNLRGETSLAEGAVERAVGAVIAVLAWTALPFAVAYLVKVQGIELSQVGYVVHSLSISGLMFAMALMLWWRKTFNRANRRIAHFVVTFGIWLPIYRIAIGMTDISIPTAVALENLVYAQIYAAIAILSDKSPFVGLAAFCISGLIGARYPEYVFEATGVANFVAISWLSYAWASQRADGAAAD